MNNATIENITIKHRGDGVYDIYFNRHHVASKGNFEAAIKFVTDEQKRLDKEYGHE